MLNTTLIGFSEYLVHGVSPVFVVLGFFVVGYIVVGFPIHRRRGAASRDVWGTVGGLLMALVYVAFLVGIYPTLPHIAPKHTVTSPQIVAR